MSNSKKSTSEIFIDKCNKIHNFYYDYSKTIYVNSDLNVIVICPKHGDFLIRASSHIGSRGCKMCGNNMITQEEFIQNANRIHNNKYDYSKVSYVIKKEKVVIMCPEHGEFNQTPHKHINEKQGCPKCVGKNKSTEEILEEFKIVHGDKYDYSLVNYKKCVLKVKIICKTHGVFEQLVAVHKMCGCPHCGLNTSMAGNSWIKSFKNDKIMVENIMNIGGKRFKVDGFDPNTNTIYEYFGSFWHGHPNRLDLVGVHPFYKISYTELYQKTLDRVRHFENNGYSVVYQWGR